MDASIEVCETTFNLFVMAQMNSSNHGALALNTNQQSSGEQGRVMNHTRAST